MKSDEALEISAAAVFFPVAEPGRFGPFLTTDFLRHRRLLLDF